MTPHPLHIYPGNCPDRIEPGQVEPLFSVEPSGKVARIEETTLGTWMIKDIYDKDTSSDCRVPVEGVEYGHITGMPPVDREAFDLNLEPRVYYVVPLVVALAARDRPDLLVPYRDVRTQQGSVIGCRQLARPV